MKTGNFEQTYEDILAQDFKDNMELFPQSNRREFLKRLGGGIIILVSLAEMVKSAEAAAERGGRPSGASDFNAYLRIGEDGRVTCFTGKIEMGQGPITSLPMELADELDVPLEMVDIVMGDTELCPNDGGTFGSQTTRVTGQKMRAAAAEAKGVLLELAAENLKVPQAQLVAEAGVVFDQQNKERKVTYSQLAKGQKIMRHLTGGAALKEPSQFKIMGKPQLRRDAHDKVTGKAQYSGDIRLPGMLYAKVLRMPAHGARLKSVDADACKQVAGVQVVQEGDLVAVLHELPDVAEDALGRIKAEFEPSPSTLDDKNIFDHILKSASPPSVRAEGGDLEEGKKQAKKKFDSAYLNGYVAHSPMEPHTALANVEGDKATVWASCQGPFTLQGEVARALEFEPKNVRVITPLVGGGFGGKSRNLPALEAARLSKAVGKPVQVMASREEEFFQDTFRPASVIQISSGIDNAGKIVFWDYDVYCAGERGAAQFYEIPNHRTASSDFARGGSEGHPFPTGAWRAPANNNNTFARESQIDIMAAAAGMDPVEFRLKNLSHPKIIGVLKAAAERFGWKPGKAPSKRGYGVALGADAGTYVASMAEVEVDAKKGTVRVNRLVVIQDMGIVVNPEGARIQMEGGATMGLGYALSEEVHFSKGKLLDTNYDTYELPRFSWVPKIETGFIASDAAPQGGGEPAIIVMGAVIGNAIFDATGARLFQMPMTPERVRAALAG
ncbi:Aldehyde oxidase and xanthine dehydrogenase molybdopterin binding [Verrucomicrobia bacterium]|nr:Aldehyde oxidase and xanthine dehydrogenase molybdopterin binding [Verrucomicrobiota bacterium]